VPAGGVFSVALTENITDRYLRSVDREDDRFFDGIIDRSKGGGSEDGVFEVVLRSDLVGSEDEGLELSSEDDDDAHGEWLRP